jgi:hypothetical protein
MIGDKKGDNLIIVATHSVFQWKMLQGFYARENNPFNIQTRGRTGFI